MPPIKIFNTDMFTVAGTTSGDFSFKELFNVVVGYGEQLCAEDWKKI